MIISASILSADFSDLAKDMKSLESSGVEWLHLDVMDGHFVPNITIGAPVIKKLKGKTDLVFDVHLMVNEPQYLINDFIEAGADYITVHAEACTHLHRVIAFIKEKGCKAGVALNPATSLDTVKWILKDLDLLLIMSVNPGYAAQKFIDFSLDKIREAKDMSCNMNIAISVDGGVNSTNAGSLIDAGCDILVAGNSIFAPPLKIGDNVSNLIAAACGK